MYKKKKILFVNGNLSIGGTEKSLVNLVNAIDKDKYEIDLLLFQPGRELIQDLDANVDIISRDITAAFGPIQDVIRRNFGERKWFELFLRLSLLLPKSIGKLLLKGLSHKFGVNSIYDVAIAYRPGFSEDLVLNCVKAKKKLTWWHHGDFSNGVDIKALKYNWRSFDQIVTVSEGIAEYIQRIIPESKGKVSIVYNMINQDEIINKSKQGNPFDDCENTLKLLTVSRLSYEKNLGRIVDIAKVLINRQIKFRWAIIGGGDLYKSLSESIKQNNLDGCITLCGESLNPYIWMRNADLVIHPSLIESFGLVLIEAMAVGTPCIAAKSLGAKDVINKENGLLVDDSDMAFANAISRICEDSLLKSELSINCANSVRKYFSEQVLNKFYSVIEV